MSFLCAPHINAEGVHGVGMTGTRAVMGKALVLLQCRYSSSQPGQPISIKVHRGVPEQGCFTLCLHHTARAAGANSLGSVMLEWGADAVT